MATCMFCGNEEVEKPIKLVQWSSGGVWNPSSGQWEKAPNVEWYVGRYCNKKYHKAIRAKMKEQVKESESLIRQGLISGIPQRR